MTAVAATRQPAIRDALAFWVSLALILVAVLATQRGGWAILLIPGCTWFLFAILDGLIGDETSGIDPETPEGRLTWYMAITRLWPWAQGAFLLGMLAWVPGAAHLSGIEKAGVFFGVGVLTGTIGITYAHELMHRPGRRDRWLADILLAMVLYGHFRSEHMLVHHRYVGTPRDAVTARYNESFPAFFARVLPGSLKSAWAAERAKLARAGRPASAWENPFWTYGALQLCALALALALGGWIGLCLFLLQAATAIWQLELVNYVEHYGLERLYRGEGRYEPAAPHHSWNAARAASNRLLINLTRHSDHHSRPARPFPLLQLDGADVAPRLPLGYPAMTTMAMIPPLWRRVMNPRVRVWRRRHYPDVTDWRGLERPMPA